MSAATLFGLCAAALVGVGVYGFIVNPQPLRKILAFNVVGSGVFLLFGAVARRGGALGGAATRCAGAADHRARRRSPRRARGRLLLRLFDETGSATLASDPPEGRTRMRRREAAR
jgi:multicomponent Na+:H+ antiporter subunit C